MSTRDQFHRFFFFQTDTENLKIVYTGWNNFFFVKFRFREIKYDLYEESSIRNINNNT